MNALIAVLITGFAATASGMVRLPVFLTDNHADSFAWIVRAFDPDQPHTLVLVDAHTDATAAERSDELREQLRRVPDPAERDRRMASWRASGRIQAFNWIEPLMPRPIDSVLWVSRPQADDPSCLQATREAVEALDGRLEFEPRSSGSFAARWHTSDMTGLTKWKPAGDVILSIDLDFFAGSSTPAEQFQTVWETAMSWPGLRGVSICVSRPWLRDDAQADRLVTIAVDAVRRTRGADLTMDVTPDESPDTSLKQAALTAANQTTPRWNLAASGDHLLTLLESAPSTWRITDRKHHPRSTFRSNKQRIGTISVPPYSPDCDGIVRIPIDSGGILRLSPGEGTTPTGRVRWFARQPALPAYDLLPETGLGKSFSQAPGRWIHERRRLIAETGDHALTATAWQAFLDPELRCGNVIVEADYETGAGWLPAREIKLRVFRGNGFHAALSECFGMPYVFGIAVCEDAGTHGVDTGWGSDCSNFLSHAWRRCGVPSPWGDPSALCHNLQAIGSTHTAGGVKIQPRQIESGLVIDFGAHVAAVWEDHAPKGILDDGDLLVHHLGGPPEIISLRDLARNRPPYTVRTLPDPPPCRIAMAGDIVPVADAAGLAELARHCAGADLVLANLEGIPSQQRADRTSIYDFRFPTDRIAVIKQAGVHVVSLANNHAADAGGNGMVQGRAALETAGLGVVGCGRDLDEALRPWTGIFHGHAIAVFGVCAVQAPAAGPNIPGVLTLPGHAAELEAALAKQHHAGVIPVVLIHWGTEHQQTPDEDQLHWARWLGGRGARLIAGSGPHVVQKPDTHAGALIHYSLGNAVYPQHLLGRGSGQVWIAAVAPHRHPEQSFHNLLLKP